MKKKSTFRFFSFNTLLLIPTIIISLGLLLSYLSPLTDPRTFKFISLFGLFYPLTLTLYIVFLLVWIIRRKWRTSFVLLFILVIGYSFHTRFFTFNSSSPSTIETADSEQTPSFSILSYNVRLFDKYNFLSRGIETRNDILRYLEETNADIMCFQEFYHENNPTKFKTVDTIKHLLNAKYSRSNHLTGRTGKIHFGVTTISRYPIIASGFVEINAVASNRILYTDIQLDTMRIRVYNVHIGSIQFEEDEYNLFSDFSISTLEDDQKQGKQLIKKLIKSYQKRAIQIDSLVNHASKSPYPVIICGDINDTPLSYAYHQLQKHYTDAFINNATGIGTTYAGKIPANRIDYIFHDKSFTSNRFSIQKEVHSDHRAITTIIGY
jgi:endonuclease/exonuclease/phosphatase family metal-dependent hydrolase